MNFLLDTPRSQSLSVVLFFCLNIFTRAFPQTFPRVLLVVPRASAMRSHVCITRALCDVFPSSHYPCLSTDQLPVGFLQRPCMFALDSPI